MNSIAPALALRDIEGRTIQFGQGRRVLLSLFREATCPFCNFRVYDLTNNYPGLSDLGLDIVVVFHSSREDVLDFIANRPRPFRMVADPEGTAHQAYGVRSSRAGKFKAMWTRMGALLSGMRMTGMRGLSTGNLMPADILIDEQGRVVEIYHGQDAGDHIPMERLALFAMQGVAHRKAA